MPFSLPPLPFAPQALEPYISERTLSFHHGKHHQAYLDALKGLVKDTPLAEVPLEDIVRQTANDPARENVFNNAAQAWNHAFFWRSLSPQGGGAPPTTVAEAIDNAFESLDSFKEQFKKAGTGQFGSGWVWLVSEGGSLKIVKTSNAGTPLTHPRQRPLLTCDVWEHAYYLDFQNRRIDFLQVFLDHLINWDFVQENLSA